MRYADTLPRRRPMFGHRIEAAATIEAVRPTSEERRMIGILIRHKGAPKPR